MIGCVDTNDTLAGWAVGEAAEATGEATPFLYFCHFAVKLKLNPQRRERLLKQNRRGDKGQLLRVEPPAGPE